MDQLPNGSRITGTLRAALAKALKKQYTAGTSIRALAADTGRSYGFIHRILAEEGITFRTRGGNQTKKTATA